MTTPSNNEVRSMHYMAYRKLRRRIQMELFAAANGKPRIPVSPAWLVIIRRSSKTMDWDNVYGGLKPLLDCLVQPTERNPDGLGFLANDDIKGMPEPPYVRQEHAGPGKGSTEILIYPSSPWEIRI